jgi:hypothetical protein
MTNIIIHLYTHTTPWTNCCTNLPHSEAKPFILKVCCKKGYFTLSRVAKKERLLMTSDERVRKTSNLLYNGEGKLHGYNELELQFTEAFIQDASCPIITNQILC